MPGVALALVRNSRESKVRQPMPDDTTGRPGTPGTLDASRPFDGRSELFGALYEKAEAGRWQLSKDAFQKALAS
jgi:hypothetical protein